ncbi:MAG: ABC transporter substrate-binding protein [Erysipelotrichaceae bacterium]|nr:ABC transporter substrate-binding protein [Erysipelotrichaceae bacterium]
MNKNRVFKFTRFSVIVMVLVSLLLGCTAGGSSSSAGSNDEEFVFIVRALGSPQTFHPDIQVDDYAYPINLNVYNKLIKLTAANTVLPDLAYDWEFAPDGSSLTFYLQEGVKWHDGEPFTSADVKWTYDMMKQENWNSALAMASVSSIECPDDYTVVFNLDYVDASILYRLSWYGTDIMPKHIYEGTDTATNPANEAPIGTGPFKFESWEKGVAVTLVKNPDFWGPEPEIDKLVFQEIVDQTTAYQAFINGEIDYLGSMPTENLFDLVDNPNYTLVDVPQIQRVYISFNMKDELTSQLAVRKAIALAIDQADITNRVGGVSLQGHYFISPMFADYIDDRYTVPETDLEEAVRVLEEAGFTKDSDGYYFTINFDFFQQKNYVDVAQVIQGNLAKVGIKVVLNLQEISAWQQKVMADDDFQMAMNAGFQGPDVSGINNRLMTDGNVNIPNYSNPEFDALCTEGVKYFDVEDRKYYYSEIQRIMSEDLPMLIVFDEVYRYPLKAEFTGYPLTTSDKAGSGEWTYLKKAD